jgi:predicted acylesterase/phospholipase RssA
MKYDLVFEGGGAKGMVFVGAYDELVRRGHAAGRLLGTSAGAITATLLAAGYTPQEMLGALNESENGRPVFAGFMGDPPPFTRQEILASGIRKLLKDVNLKFVPDFLENKMDDAIAGMLAENSRSRHFFAFVERGGWYAADRFVTWLQEKLDSGPWKDGQRHFSGMTLRQFFDETQAELSVVASDTSEGRLLVLNHMTAPDCPLVWAVRMSMSIPLLWNEVIWEDSWGPYLGRPMKGHIVVDGGMLSNFPIELFISGEPQVTRLMGPKQDVPVLGLLIDEALPVGPARKGLLIDIDVKPGELKTVRRFKRLVDTLTGAHDKMVIEAFDHLVVRLPAAGYGTTEFDMSDERRDALVDAGKRAVRAYFDHPPAPPPIPRGMEDIATEKVQKTADRVAARILGL